MEPETTDPAAAEEDTEGAPRERGDLPPMYTQDSFVEERTDGDAPKPTPLVLFPLGFELLALPASLLPRWVREKVGADQLPLRFGGIASGFLQTGVALFLFGYFFMDYYYELVTLEAVGVVAQHAATRAPFMAMGMSVFFGFLFTTLEGSLCAYFFFEGGIRAFSSASGQPLGTAPLWLIGLAAHRLFRLNDDRKAMALVADEVHRDGGHMGIRIDTCRERHWTKTDAFLIDGEQYCIVTQRIRETGQRRFQYFLEPTKHWFEPDSVIEYSPELILGEAKPTSDT